jgi:hypothetical protein
MCPVIGSLNKFIIPPANDSLINSLEVFIPNDNGLVVIDTSKLKGVPGIRNMTIIFEANTKKKNMTI